MIKINRYIQDKFGSEDNLTTQLKSFADKEKNGNVTVDQFKEFLTATLSKELLDRKVSKRDIEGFLSAFVYNKYGATNVDKIAPLVFEKNANTLSLKLASVTRANPPPEFVNEDLGFTQPIKINGDNANAKRIRDLLVEIETATFLSKPSTYNIFKSFDVDGDGFVSYKDFERHLKAMKINASQSEIQTIMKNVLDVNQNGYIDYSEFSKRFGPNMSR